MNILDAYLKDGNGYISRNFLHSPMTRGTKVVQKKNASFDSVFLDLRLIHFCLML